MLSAGGHDGCLLVALAVVNPLGPAAAATVAGAIRAAKIHFNFNKHA
jgi:hypothetical protein